MDGYWLWPKLNLQVFLLLHPKHTLLNAASVIEGKEFRQRVLDSKGEIDQAEFNRIWKPLRVMARCSPNDKLTIVKGMISPKTGNSNRMSQSRMYRQWELMTATAHLVIIPIGTS